MKKPNSSNATMLTSQWEADTTPTIRQLEEKEGGFPGADFWIAQAQKKPGPPQPRLN